MGGGHQVVAQGHMPLGQLVVVVLHRQGFGVHRLAYCEKNPVIVMNLIGITIHEM
ncbi:hypothetical protein D3C85_1767750 [compost metagenome]